MSSAAPQNPSGTEKPQPEVRRGSSTSAEGEPPPAPPRELPRSGAEAREFTHEGQRWTAWLSGKGASGTGSYGLALIDAVHFAAAERPEVPLREALLARGRFELLFEEELITLFERATPITPAADRP